MERKTEHFFDGDQPSLSKIVQKLQQYPQEAEQIIGKEKKTTANILNKMVDNLLIKKVGNGPSTKYVLR